MVHHRGERSVFAGEFALGRVHSDILQMALFLHAERLATRAFRQRNLSFCNNLRHRAHTPCHGFTIGTTSRRPTAPLSAQSWARWLASPSECSWRNASEASVASPQSCAGAA